MTLCRAPAVLSWIGQIVAAAILFQTLFFKFTGAEESRYIFSTLGAEPWGRLAAGIAEALCVILLLIPRTAATGAVLSVAVASGAILAHLTRLGIVIKDDGGLLFLLAIIVLVASTGVAWLRRAQLPILGPCFTGAACGV